MAILTFFASGKKKLDAKKEELRQKTEAIRLKVNESVDGKNSDTDTDNLIEQSKEGVKTEEQTPLGNAKVKVMALITAIVTFFEVLPLFFSLMIWIILFLCLLVIVVIIFSLLSILEQAVLDSELKFEGEVGAACGQSGGSVTPSGGTLAWTDAELASRGATLSDYEKNLYRLGILARKAAEGYGGGELMMTEGATLDMRVAFLMGVASTETSMRFYTGGQNSDITKIPSTIASNSSGYGFMGISSAKSLGSYYGASTVSAIQKAYKPSSPPAYPAAYAPYGVAMSAKHHQQDFAANTGTKSTKAQIDKIAGQWGIKANKGEFSAMSQFFLAQAEYHGAAKSDYEGLINFFGALFVATSDNDAERTFSKWTLKEASTTSGNDFSESGIRNSFVGAGGKDSLAGRADTSGLKNGGNTKILLNGKEIGVPVWKYLGDKYMGTAGFKQAWADVKMYSARGGGGIGARVLNFHYGFNSYIQAKRIESILAKKMNIVGQASPTAPSTTVPADGDTPPTTLPPVETAPSDNDPKSLTVLVNKETKLPSDYKPDLVRPNVAFSFGDAKEEKSMMRKEAGTALEEMFAGAKKEKVTLYAVSGYRSYARQEELYKAKIKEVGEEKAKTIVAPPGTSEHQTGLVMDISSKGHKFALNEKFETTTEGKWLKANAHKYGFILRYPKGKEAITGYIYEPWHFRYVGKDLATKLFTDNKTLDEHIKENPPKPATPPPSSGDNCVEEGEGGDTVNVVPGNFKPTPGKGQATINGKTTEEYLKDYYKRASPSKIVYLNGLKQHFGTSSFLSTKGNPASAAGYVDKDFGVPFYGQWKGYTETYGTTSYVPGGNTFYISACMIYSYAYAASAMTGKMINPAEMGAIIHANDGFLGNLIYTRKLPAIYKQMGISAQVVENGSSFAGFDSTLAKGGVVVIRTRPGPEKFTSSQHFQVITGKTTKNGTTYYNMYTSSKHQQSMVTYTKAQIQRNMHKDALLVWK